MSTNCDGVWHRKKFQRPSHACRKGAHALCVFLVRCACACHAEAAAALVDKLLEEAERRAKSASVEM